MVLYNQAKLRNELIVDEGRKNVLYKDTKGITTGGIGHNFTKPLSDAVISLLFNEDIAEAEAALDQLDPWWRKAPEAIQRNMMNLMFNMGPGTWAEFKNTRAALARGDYESAAQGLEKSRWYAQVQKSRKERIVSEIRAQARPLDAPLLAAGAKDAEIASPSLPSPDPNASS